jgi:protocatechuate 3,4-dioxygenase beta subunit
MKTLPDDAKGVTRRRRLRPCLPAALLLLLLVPLDATAGPCKPTEPDALGPFYKPGAPMRRSVGRGYVLAGTVRSAKDCAPVEGAVIELWLAGPDGGYGDAYRATVIADGKGAYRFESHVPPPYYGRPPHIHLRVSARGFDTLVTQHYPEEGGRKGTFDIVLVPVR